MGHRIYPEPANPGLISEMYQQTRGKAITRYDCRTGEITKPMTLTGSIPWLILGLAALVVLLVRGRGYHESANRVVRECCSQNGLQLLDGTVAFRGLSVLPQRPCITRTYRFEYSRDGTDRHMGLITLTGNEVIALLINPDHLAAQTIH